MSFEIKILHQTNKNILVTLKVTAFFHFSLERSLVRSRISVGKPWYAAKTHMLGKLLWQHVTQNNYRFSFLSKDISNLLHFTHVYWVWWNATLTLCILLFDTAYWSFGLYHILMRISCIFSSWNSPAYIWSHRTDVNSDQNPLNTFQILEEVLESLFTIFKGKNIFKSLQSHRRQGMMHEVCSGNSVVWCAVVWWWQMSLLCVFFLRWLFLHWQHVFWHICIIYEWKTICRPAESNKQYPLLEQNYSFACCSHSDSVKYKFINALTCPKYIDNIFNLYQSVVHEWRGKLVSCDPVTLYIHSVIIYMTNNE